MADMNILINRLKLYRENLQKKYMRVESLYYNEIDELIEKLDDIEINPIPLFDLREFTFINDWSDGNITSSAVLKILESFAIEDVAKNRITRRLFNYMFDVPETADYVKDVLERLKERVVPIYIDYLKVLTMYFKKLEEIDKRQEKITWLRNTFSDETGSLTEVQEYTFNQAIKYLDTFVLDKSEVQYTVGNNIIVFGESKKVGNPVFHWLFAPKSYVDFMKDLYDIKEKMDIGDNTEYIKNMIGRLSL